MTPDLDKTCFLLTLTIVISSLTMSETVHGVNKKNLSLSEKDILKEVLSSSLFIKKIQLIKKKQLARLLEKKYSFSDWETFSSFTQSKRKNPNIAIFQGKESEVNNFSVGLEKKIPYGLSLKPSFSYTNENKTYSDFLKRANVPENIYRENLSLELNANLGSALVQYWSLEAINEGQKINEWLYYEMAEELALKAAGQYWKTYLAWITYTQTNKGLKTYRRLVRQINNKKKYGFLRPGERPQILAEYENIQQASDKAKQKYKNEEKALLLFLKKDPELHNIRFKKASLFPLPRFSKINIEKTRSIKIKKKQINEQELKWKASKIRLYPSLHFSSKGGLIPGASSYEDLAFNSENFFYEIGVSLKWNFFSKSFREKVKIEKYTLEENKTDLKISKQKLRDRLTNLEKEIVTSYKNVQRAKRANSYQKKAFRELQNSFDQGRVDIFELINTENKLRESELRKKSALSEYFLLNLQLLALRDQLVEDYLKP